MNSLVGYDEGQAVANFITDAQVKMAALMNEIGVTRAELANRLGVSRSRVTQLFGDRPNLTAETIARVFYALGESISITGPVIEDMIRRFGKEEEKSLQESDANVVEQILEENVSGDFDENHEAILSLIQSNILDKIAFGAEGPVRESSSRRRQRFSSQDQYELEAA